MEDPCLYATNPLFGADGEGARVQIESPSVARARWVGLPEMPNCSVSTVCYFHLFVVQILFVKKLLALSQFMAGAIPYGVKPILRRPCPYFHMVFSIR
jgi:hypothetical protein